MSVPRAILHCSVTGCDSTWYQLIDCNHGAVIRGAVRDGWTGSGEGTGCLCGQPGIRCPKHSGQVRSDD